MQTTLRIGTWLVATALLGLCNQPVLAYRDVFGPQKTYRRVKLVPPTPKHQWEKDEQKKESDAWHKKLEEERNNDDWHKARAKERAESDKREGDDKEKAENLESRKAQDAAMRVRYAALARQEQGRLDEVAKARNSGKFALAVVLLEKMAADGSPNAPYMLGTMYQNGNGVKADKNKALTWFFKAAQNGSGNGSYAIARAYLDGDGVKPDTKQAITWLKASNAPPAKSLLGSMYLLGADVENDFTAAWKCFKESNDPTAKAGLGEICYLGLGAKRNVMEAKTWFESAALSGNPKALFYLGKIYEMGDEGVPKDESRARDYFARYQTNMKKLKTASPETPIGFRQKILARDIDDLDSRFDRLRKQIELQAASEPNPSSDTAVLPGKDTLAASPTIAVDVVGSVSPTTKSPEASSKSMAEVFTEVETLVKTFYPKVKTVTTDKTLHFEFKARETELWHGKTTQIPSLGGIIGDMKLTDGSYQGKEILPAQTNGHLYVSLLMAPFSEPKNSHLLTLLKFPPDAPIDFVDRFKLLVSSYAQTTPTDITTTKANLN